MRVESLAVLILSVLPAAFYIYTNLPYRKTLHLLCSSLRFHHLLFLFTSHPQP